MVQRIDSKAELAAGLAGAAGGALLMYLFDPRVGRSRRARSKDRALALLRRWARQAERHREQAKGYLARLRHLNRRQTPPPNDETLKDKIESEVLARGAHRKGQINVNVASGIVWLRGTCRTPEEISEIEQEVRKVTGVLDVHNLLHLPGTPAPTP